MAFRVHLSAEPASVVLSCDPSFGDLPAAVVAHYLEEGDPSLLGEPVGEPTAWKLRPLTGLDLLDAGAGVRPLGRATRELLAGAPDDKAERDAWSLALEADPSNAAALFDANRFNVETALARVSRGLIGAAIDGAPPEPWSPEVARLVLLALPGVVFVRVVGELDRHLTRIAGGADGGAAATPKA